MRKMLFCCLLLAASLCLAAPAMADECENNPAYANQQLREQDAVPMDGTMWITGVVDDELYIVLTTTGETGYMPQEWFCVGNG